MKEQLKELMNREGLSANRFAALVGVQASAISHIISGRNKPGYDFIVNIIDAFPAYNPEWIITGKGEMLRATANGPTGPSSTPQEQEPMPHPDDDASVELELVTDEPSHDNIEEEFTETFSSEGAPELPFDKAEEQIKSNNDSDTLIKPEPSAERRADYATLHRESLPDNSIHRIIAIYADNTFEELKRR